MTAYATLEDVLALFETEPKETRHPRLVSLLEVAAQEINGELGGRDYLRHPTTGDATWYVDGHGGRVLHVHEGVISLTSIGYSDDRGETFTDFEATDYELRGIDYDSTETADGEPYFHLVLKPLATRSSFPRGTSTIRLIGARGWSPSPVVLVEANAQRARQLAYSDPSFSGSLPGPPEFDAGGAYASFHLPDVMWRFVRNQNRRFMPCSM